MKLEFAAEALDEWIKATDHYERTYPGRGVRFVAAVERTLEAIVAGPLSFAVFLRMSARAAAVPRFPYRIVYAVRAGRTIRILAVAHAKRRPAYWSGRLSDDR